VPFRKVFAFSAAIIVLLAMAGLATDLHQSPDLASGPTGTPAPIVFVCQNGVAMSIWSALTFNRLAAERGLPIRAVSRASAATYTSVPLRMRVALAFDGFRVGDYQPRVVSADDVRAAQRVVLIDTDLPASASVPGQEMETWDGFPPMREKYFESRTALRTRVEELVARLAATHSD
jgi:hypothetical protein